jgi:hypothetical protein
LKPRALISVHDVAPAALDDVLVTLNGLRDLALGPVTLFVLSDESWCGSALSTLKRLHDEGHELAAQAPGGPPAQGPKQTCENLRQARHWFVESGLPAPMACSLPAQTWPRPGARDLGELGYRVVETLPGVHCQRDDGSFRLQAMPLLAFEAATRTRARFLADWNRLQLRLARRGSTPPRIALQPADYCRGDGQMRGVLGLGWSPLRYAELPALLMPSRRGDAA